MGDIEVMGALLVKASQLFFFLLPPYSVVVNFFFSLFYSVLQQGKIFALGV